MTFREREINVYTGQGRHFFELYLSPQSPRAGKMPKKRLCKRLTLDSDPGDAAAFAFTEDLFIPNKILVFPDFDVLNLAFQDVVKELIEKREDVKATVLLPVKNSAKMRKVAGKDIDVVQVSEAAAKKVAVGYVKGIFEAHGIGSSADLIEVITLPWVDDPHGLISEAEKLTLAFSKTKVVTIEGLMTFSGARPEIEVFSILRELIRGKASKGIRDFSRYLNTVDDSEILRVLGALQWALKREYGRAKGVKRRDTLIKLFFLAGEIDLKIKGDSRLPAREIFMNALVSMAEIAGG